MRGSLCCSWRLRDNAVPVSVLRRHAKKGRHMSRPKMLCVVLFAFHVAPLGCATAQGPFDLFSDVPELNQDFIRIGAWNLRHINLEDGAANFLPGNTQEEDFAILIAPFAKAIQDLGLDVVAISEVQPRAGEVNRLSQIRDKLNDGGSTWQADQTDIDYVYNDGGNAQFGNLQLGLLWKTNKVTIDPTADKLLSDLRQPRNPDGSLKEKTLRAPWLVPITAAALSFDLVVLHLKSGGDAPQADEVEALKKFIADHQSEANPRHLIVCGDWNIRPDRPQGQGRLRKMQVTSGATKLMRILTVEQIRPTIDEWEALSPVELTTPFVGVLPVTHFSAQYLDSFLDHIAISQTLNEIFDHPIRMTTKDGKIDTIPGVYIPSPQIIEGDCIKFTDHLPVVLTLRTSGGDVVIPPAGGLVIVGAIPNPTGDDTQDEEVRLRNTGTTDIALDGWKIGDSTAGRFWKLEALDGTVQVGATISIIRRGRNMFLDNAGDTIRLIDPTGKVVDSKSYGQANSGKVFSFN